MSGTGTSRTTTRNTAQATAAPTDGSTAGAQRGVGMSWEVARRIGAMGEQLAVDHLEGAGLEVIERNWCCPSGGELDIVARDGDLLVFCEVKTRRSDRFGRPVEQITHAKAARLRRLAWSWLRERGEAGRAFRIDVVGVLARAGRPPQVEHLQAVA